jgi:hypothetical protein
MKLIRSAPFAFKVLDNSSGRTAVIYRRRRDAAGRDRLQRIAKLSPLAFTAGMSLLKDAAAKSIIAGSSPQANNGFLPGKLYPMDSDWGSRVACFSFITAGLRNAERILKAAAHMREADGNDAAWWLGMLWNDGKDKRALRALRILAGAVK